ncbi:MAG TPA: ATP-binding protein [Rhodospirillales bacterium]|nr:ATP-binding protein [Rhodospirillales bacterium]
MDQRDKFTPPKGQIKVLASVDASNAMKWQVIDTGVGIPAKDLRRVLQPFEQV